MKTKIIELKLTGLSHNEISKQLNCSKGTVSKYFSIMNKVIELRNEEKTYDEIKKETNLSEHLIRLICKQEKLVYKGKFLNRFNSDDIIKMQEFYDDGHTINETSIKFNCSNSTLIKRLKTKNKMSDEEYKSRKSKSVIEWRKRTKIKLVEYKGGKCEKCNYDKCIHALEFHHLDPNEKDFTISGKSWSFERLKKEVDKCIMLCSNCHTEIHYIPQ